MNDKYLRDFERLFPTVRRSFIIMENKTDKYFLYRHVAVIMDGNRRWAKGKNLDPIEGHRKGSEVFRDSINWCIDIGVKEYTVYAFSCENWNRTEKEVTNLMSLFSMYIDEIIKRKETDTDSIYKQIRLRFIGRRDRLSEVLHDKMNLLEEESKNNTLLLVNICLDYSGQWDISQSCMQLLEAQRLSHLLGEETTEPWSIEEITTKLSNNLSTGDSQVDVLIRTGGEYRISNFLLWQISYAEIYIVDQYWPDLTFDSFRSALNEVANRNRRFGK